MNLRRALIHGILYFPYVFNKVTGTGAFGPGGAEDIDPSVLAESNPLKAALLKHHVKQFNGSACSVASVVSVVNTLRDLQHGPSIPISQRDILESVRTAHWKERMSRKGYNGKRGLPLPVLGEVVQSSLDTYGIRYRAVETVPASKKPGRAQKIREILLKRLWEFENRGTCLIIAHFDQGTYVQALNIPHISPVGGFDAQTGKVVVLDVDPEQEKPYRIDFDTFYRGLSSDYHHMLSFFGYRGGGYVWVQLF